MVENNKTNLFVIGAMKAGTTSFNELLDMHPSIYYSPIKEPHFFVDELPKSIYEPSRFFNIDNYFDNKFPNKLHIAHIKKLSQYNKLFSLSNDNHKYLAEGSTCYLHAPESAKNIYKYNSNAKIILLTRNPLKRAFSHYNMDVGMGRTKETFQQEMNKCIAAFENDRLSNWSYLGMSLYYENTKRYKELFGNNVLIVKFEDLIKDKPTTLKRVFNFLEIKDFDINVPHNNASSQIKYAKLLYALKRTGIKDFFSFIVPKKIRHIIFSLISSDKKKDLELKQSTINILDNYFSEDKEHMKKGV